MSSKDASGRRNLKSFLSLAISALVVLAVCLAARNFWGTNPATAQAPVRRAPQTKNRPTANPRPAATARAQAGARPVAAQPAARTASRPTTRRPATSSNVADPKMKVMALVNGQQVTREQLASECLRRYGKDVLESIVNKHLIYQACEAQGITITPQEVEDEIKRTAANFALSKERWLETLREERDISANHYRNEIIWPTLALRKLAAEKIVVTEDELRKAIESQYGPAVRVRMISVASRQKAEQLWQPWCDSRHCKYASKWLRMPPPATFWIGGRCRFSRAGSVRRGPPGYGRATICSRR